MTNGRVSSVSFRGQLGRVGRRVIDGLSWTASCGFCERAPPGVICRRNLVRGRPSGICSTSGMVTELWTKSCDVCKQHKSKRERSTRSCGAWMEQLFEPPVAVQGAEKKGSRGAR